MHQDTVEDAPRYPARAWLVVGGAWLLFAFSVLVYACISLLLLPALPAIFYGQVCLLASAHEYARSVARPRPSRRAASAPVQAPRATATAS